MRICWHIVTERVIKGKFKRKSFNIFKEREIGRESVSFVSRDIYVKVCKFPHNYNISRVVFI